MRLEPNRPVETTTPKLVVEDLPAGTHRIRLVVVADSGQRSQPTEVVIRVVNAGTSVARMGTPGE